MTNAFMQHPVGQAIASNGSLALADMRAYLLNEWALVQFARGKVRVSEDTHGFY